MGNLGWYQLMTTVAKRVGGPKQLFALVFGGGAVVGSSAVAAGSAIKRKMTQKPDRKEREATDSVVYTVNRNGRSNKGLRFEVGEKFKVLETDGNAGLIEKLGDSNNPYFVSLNFLRSISNYELA